MNAVVPPRFLFRWSFPVRHWDGAPAAKGRLLDLPADHILPWPTGFDAGPTFAEVRLGWNAGGLALAVSVAGKRLPLRIQPQLPAESDGVQLWIDTRATQTVHRATRFCHHFCLLPTAGKSSKTTSPLAVGLPIARAREDATATDATGVKLWSELRPDGYLLEAWIPAEALTGYDPAGSPRMSWYLIIRDAELGDQTLTVGREFPFDADPSLWQTLELVR